jgi:DNA gyrase subunit A
VERVPGPDFPTGGILVGDEGILQAYSTGRGRLVVRGVAHIEEMGSNRHRIVITEIPYLLNKTSLIERIADLAREGRLDDISDLRDESDRRGMSIIIELKRGAQPKKVINKLYKYTPLQSTFGVQLLALVDGEPRLISLKRALQIFIEHRREVIRRRSEFELARARERAHILDGLLIALAHLDDVIQTIRQSPDVETARQRLIERFNLSERQAQAILDMQLRRLAALERQKIEDEHKQMLERIAFLEDLLSTPRKILVVIRDDLLQLSEKYGDERRTHIARDANEEFHEEDLVQDTAVLISMTQRGYIKRVLASAFRAQSRGGRGVSGQPTRSEDEIINVIPARTLDTILFFTDRGKVYSEKAYQIPEADRTGRGIAIVNILALEAGETITAAVAVPRFDPNHFCMMATRQGRIKRIALSEFAAVRPSGMLATTLEKGDRLGWVGLTNGSNQVLVVTEQGQALRFAESEVRAMGRTAGGVTAIKLDAGDRVAGMEVVEPGGELLVVTARGYGKRTPLDEYPVKGRAGGGVRTTDQKALDRTGLVVAARVVQENDDLTIMTSGGLALRTRVRSVSQNGRTARGSHLIELQGNEVVAAVARIVSVAAPEASAEPKTGGNGKDPATEAEPAA